MSGMARIGAKWVIALGCCVWLSAPRPVQAYCRSMSCSLGEARRVEQGGKPCGRDASGCVSEGQPQHWAGPCIDYAVQVDGSPKLRLDADQFQQIVEQTFAAWQHVSCPGGGSPRFQARFQGFVGCDRHEYVCGDASHNVSTIMFHDTNWAGPVGVLGITTPTGRTSSGLIDDTDLELDSQDYPFLIDDSKPGVYELREVLAHELGHFLGLDHSRVSGALMSEDYAQLWSSRELFTADDVAAICAVFPPGAPLECGRAPAVAYDACQLTPGVDEECELTTNTSKGCSLGGWAPRADVALLGLFVGVLGLRSRRRAPRGGSC
jgi:hypothetical protein